MNRDNHNYPEPNWVNEDWHSNVEYCKCEACDAVIPPDETITVDETILCPKCFDEIQARGDFN